MEKDNNQEINDNLDSFIKKLVVIKDFDRQPLKTGERPSVVATIEQATKARDSIVALVHQDPEILSKVVEKLVDIGSDFDIIKKGEKLGHLLGMQENLVDGKISSKIVVETILEIGKPALPILKKRRGIYAKFLADKLRSEIRV